MTEQYVLIVDDDPAFSQFTRNLLTDKEMRVVVAASKTEGLEAFERERPSCVILDIFLPDGSGVDLIKPMRAASLTIPIIMVSGQSEVDEVVRAMKEGASDYVKKPFQGEELLLKMQMVFDVSHAKVELDQLRIKTRPEEEYNLLFGMSDRMSKVQAVLDQVAGTDITVLITGESGTGKELVAKAIHKASDRANDPFIKVNCAALAAGTARERTVRLREGGVHRRPPPQVRPLRDGAERHHLPRRDQRDALGPAVEIAPCPAGEAVLPNRRRARGEGELSHPVRHQQEPGTDGRGGECSAATCSTGSTW